MKSVLQVTTRRVLNGAWLTLIFLTTVFPVTWNAWEFIEDRRNLSSLGTAASALGLGSSHRHQQMWLELTHWHSLAVWLRVLLGVPVAFKWWQLQWKWSSFCSYNCHSSPIKVENISRKKCMDLFFESPFWSSDTAREIRAAGGWILFP